MSREYKPKQIAGIYCIYNKKLDKYYIGRSSNIFSRWNNHLQDLLYKRHHNKFLQADFDLGHYTDFEFSIVKIMSAKKLVDAEKVFIQNYKQSGKALYNIVSA